MLPYQRHNVACPEMRRITKKAVLGQTFRKHKEFFRTGSVFSSAASCLLNLPICLEVLETKTVNGCKSLSTVGDLIKIFLLMRYSDIIGDMTVFYVNLIAALLNVFYLFIFSMCYEGPWEEINLPTQYAAGMILVAYFYAYCEKKKLLRDRFGILLVVAHSIVTALPLVIVPKVLTTRDSTYISYPLNLMGFLSSFLWLFNGFAMENKYLIVTYFIGLFVHGLQLIIIAVINTNEIINSNV